MNHYNSYVMQTLPAVAFCGGNSSSDKTKEHRKQTEAASPKKLTIFKHQVVMKKTISALMCMAGLAILWACAGGSNGKSAGSDKSFQKITLSKEEMREKGYALTYEVQEDGGEVRTVILSRKGRNQRVDIIGDEVHRVYLSVREADDDHYYQLGNEGWEESYIAGQNLTNSSAGFSDQSWILGEKAGFAKKGTEEICGQTCDVWGGTYTGKVTYGSLAPGASGEYAVWNGFMLRAQYDKPDGGIATKFECTNLKIDIPDQAFEQDEDVSWAN